MCGGGGKSRNLTYKSVFQTDDIEQNNEKYRIGYTQGVYDMFHIGHLNLINHAKEMCDILIVGVNSDELVREYKFKSPIIHDKERAEIVKNLKAVDFCEIVKTLDKIELYKRYGFDVVFIGDDWKGSERWTQTEKDLSVYGVKVIYLPYTVNESSSRLRGEFEKHVEEYR